MVDIVYVEDDPNDADIFSRLIKKMDRSITFTVLKSGSEAVEYLSGSNQTGALPKLILMDLNLNGLSGFYVIEHARSLERTKYLPIVAFSTSDSPRDIHSAYEAGVNAYVVKPGSYQATGSIIGKMCDFWLENNIRIDHR
ncbi:response regulator [Spirosoma sp.]|uniref:response regulator n=1 Tax=Spirosoma sp. TaxID=1899569 RepID=UPI003B3B6A7F